MLTTVIGEAGREVMASRTRREAEAIVDAAVAMIERLGVLAEEADTTEPPTGPEDDSSWSDEVPQPGAGTAIAGA